MTPEQLRECPIDQCVENTDREIYRGPDDGCGDFYSDRLHITQEGALGIDCGGYVIVRPIRAWHGIAKAHADALEEVEQLKRARDLLVMALHRATGQPKERIAEAPTSVAVEHAKQIVRAESALADAERKIERLKHHAEAMAVAWEKLDFDDGESEDAMEESVFAYRAEFKE